MKKFTAAHLYERETNTSLEPKNGKALIVVRRCNSPLLHTELSEHIGTPEGRFSGLPL